jgi:hypothetical protein
MNIVPWLPRIVLDSKVFPFDKVPQLPIDHPGIQNFLYYPFFFSINYFRERGWNSLSAWNRVFWRWSQLHHVEHRMQAV